MNRTFFILPLAFVAAACASNNPPPPAYTPPMTKVVSADTCPSCGTVTAVEPVEQKGSATGAGAIIGAVIGGVVGHQFGSGRGQDAATAGGAIAGGVAGHQAEKAHNETTLYYRISVDMDNDTMRTVNVATTEGVTPGSRVRLVGNDMEVLSR